jgi:5'(3')-deoxyribonucleotidase
MQRIAIDMDDVIADTIGHYLRLYNADFGRNLQREDLNGKHVFASVPPEDVPRVRQYFQKESFFSEIDVMPGSQEVVKALASRYEVFVATAAMEVPDSFTPKFRWLQQHFPFVAANNIVFCGDKSIIHADFLIDDNVRHFARFQGEGILFTAPHNGHETRWRRVNGWQEVRALFL